MLRDQRPGSLDGRHVHNRNAAKPVLLLAASQIERGYQRSFAHWARAYPGQERLPPKVVRPVRLSKMNISQMRGSDWDGKMDSLR